MLEVDEIAYLRRNRAKRVVVQAKFREVLAAEERFRELVIPVSREIYRGTKSKQLKMRKSLTYITKPVHVLEVITLHTVGVNKCLCFVLVVRPYYGAFIFIA